MYSAEVNDFEIDNLLDLYPEISITRCLIVRLLEEPKSIIPKSARESLTGHNM